jgi:hypothetical protein
MSFSRNAASYFPRPRLRSQTTMSMTAPTQGCYTSSCGLGRVSRRTGALKALVGRNALVASLTVLGVVSDGDH